MASRRNSLTQLETLRARALHHAETITPEALKAWYDAINDCHSRGYKPVSYEPAVSSSNEPAIPSLDRDDRQIQYAAQTVTNALRRIDADMRLIDTQLRAWTTTTKRQADPDVKGCVNPNCTTVMSNIGRDRPIDGAGHCARCYAWLKRKGAEWTPRQGAYDLV